MTAIKSTADEFIANENYAAVLTIYEVLVTEAIEHFNDYRDEYIAFSVILMGCIDSLDTCFAGKEDNPKIGCVSYDALPSTTSIQTSLSAHRKHHIGGRQVTASWVREALAEAKGAKWSSRSRQQRYSTFLLVLEKEKKDHE